MLVSSVSVAAAVDQRRDASVCNLVVGSWTFEEHLAACTGDDFYESVKANLGCPDDTGLAMHMSADDEADGEKMLSPDLQNKNKMLIKEALLMSKYRYAGGSARWMFDFDFKDCLEDIDLHLSKVTSYTDLFTSASGEAAVNAVNHLRGVTICGDNRSERHFFISQHVATALANKCDNKRKFLADGYRLADAAGNPAFGGWIFEFDVDYQLSEASKVKESITVQVRQTGAAKKTEVWRVSEYVTFDAVTELIPKLAALAQPDVLWAKPTSWCQKAYDFLAFKKEGATIHMQVVNATRAEMHTVLLDVVNTLGRNLQESGVDAIRFLFLVPTNHQFKVGQVTGQLGKFRAHTAWKNTQGTYWPARAAADALVSARCVEVAEVSVTV